MGKVKWDNGKSVKKGKKNEEKKKEGKSLKTSLMNLLYSQ